jgi:plastocyanin
MDMGDRVGVMVWVRISGLAAVLLGALAFLPPAPATTGAATCARDLQGQVRILGRVLDPATIRIGPGKAVTWISCGAGNRRVASSTAAWTPFTLRPTGQRRLVFPRVGRYPYTVDGKTKGVVIVAVLGTAAPAPGTGQAERTVRYDIRVSASYRYRQTLDGGLVETAIAYVGTWGNVPVKLYDAGGTVTAVGRSTRGTLDAKLEYSDARGETHCQGTLDYPAYPATASLAGGRVKGSAPYFSFDSDVTDQGPYSDLTDQRTQACDDLPASDARTVWLGNPFRVAPGIVIEPPGAGVGEMDAGFRRQGGTGIPFPLDRVRAGKGFTIVGPRTIGPQSCGLGCSESSTGRVEFRFTPRR